MRRLLGHTLAAVASAAALLLVAAGPAAAVQTDTFGLTSSSGHTVSLRPTGGVVHGSLIVYNRTSKPLTVQLQVVGLRPQPGGSYEFVGPNRGLAPDLTLPANEVRLGPHEQRPLTISVRTPRRQPSPLYAAVMAVANDVNAGAVQIRPRLAVLVSLAAGVAPTPAGGWPSVLPWWLVAVAAALLAAVGGGLGRALRAHRVPATG